MLNLSRIQVAGFLACVSFLQVCQTKCIAAETEWEQHFNAGMKALQEGHLVQGENLLKDTIKMDAKQGGTEIKQAQSSMVLADFYRSQSRFSEAEVLYKQLLAKFESGPAGDELLAVMNKLAGLYKAENKLDDALALYKKSLALVEKQDGADSAASGTIHANFGLIYQRMGKLKEAEAEERTAITIFQAKLGNVCPEAAQCMCDLAQQYMFEHKIKQEIQILEQALAIYAKVAADGLRYARCAEQLGSAYYSAGRYSDAEELSRKSLAIHQKQVGPYSKSVAITLTNLAEGLAKQGKNQEALNCFYKSIAILEKATQLSSGMLANLHGIAEIYVLQADYKKAETILRQDLAFREKKWGPKHVSMIPALKNLAGCLVLEGAPEEESAVLLNRAEEILAEVPVTKRRMVAELTAHDMVKGLDLNSKKFRKTNEIW